jgi:hypothetical protein
MNAQLIGAITTKEYISTNAVIFTRVRLGAMLMAETQEIHKEDFWLFHDIEDQEITELRKFIDPELDLSSIKGIDKLFDKLNHLLE